MQQPYVLHEVCAPEAAGESGARARGPRSVGSWTMLFLVRIYIVFLSPFLGGACKFYPSCSNYAREAIERHGARRGTLLALKRLLRCHPFTPGGIDFVPEELPDSARAAHSHLAISGQGKAQ
jgi:putative membrane protein insertion efficiency factor